MKDMAPQQPAVVVYVNGSPCGQDGTAAAGQSFGQWPGPPAGRYDPYKLHRGFPERWARYIRANFRNVTHVCQVFNVCERTARKWWTGESGAVGGHVAIAVNEHPETAPQMLFAAE